VSRSIEFIDRGERVVLRKRCLASVDEYPKLIERDTP